MVMITTMRAMMTGNSGTLQAKRLQKRASLLVETMCSSFLVISRRPLVDVESVS